MPEPIQVILKDDTGVEVVSGSSGGAVATNNQAVENKQSKSNNKSSQFAAAGVYVAMQTANYVTSNIGKYTGNNQVQRNINNAKRVVGYGMALATNVWMGLAVIAVDSATSIADYMWERKWDAIRAGYAQARTGDLGGFRR